MHNIKQQTLAGLKWLEKYTKTDMVYLAKGGFWLGIGQVLSTGMAFLLSIAFANLLPRETYGVYRYILSIASILTIPTLSGMDSAVTRAVAQGFEGSLVDALKTKLKWGLFTTLAGVGLGLYYFVSGNNTLAIGFVTISVFIPLWESFDIYSSFLNGKKLFNKYTQYYGSIQIISGLCVFASLLFTKNVLAILTAYYLVNTAIRIIFFRQIIKTFHPNNNIDPDTISYGKHLSFIDIIGTFLGQLDKILLFHYLGAGNLALYSVSIAPSENIKGMLKNIHSLALPKFANRDKEEVKRGLIYKIFQLGIFVGLITIAYIILAPYFFHFLFPKYIDGIKYSQILSLSLIGTSISSLLYTYLEAHQIKKSLYKFNIYSNIVNFVILVPFVYYWGILGAIVARVIIRISSCFILFFMIKNNN
jgi:O-antigen/teichoic acid export membrane protein